MSREAVEALRNEVAAVVSLSGRWSAEQWSAPSRAVGWSSKDVMCHLAANFQLLCDPGGVPNDPSLGEHSVDLAVEQRRQLLPHEVLDQYITWSDAALSRLAAMQAADSATQVVPMGILGSHPRHLLANAYAFDHHCHVRHDLDVPSGERWPAHTDPHDLTTAAVEWMMAAAPQMCGAAFGRLSGLVELHVDTATWTMVATLGHPIEIVSACTHGCPDDEPPAPVLASICSSSEDFVLWGTQRVSANELDVELGGDRRIAQFVIEHFKVF